jgi:hypothetical protein
MRAHEFITEAGPTINRDKVRAALWQTYQQDFGDEASPEQMDDDEYNDFEQTVDDILSFAVDNNISNAHAAVAKYGVRDSQNTIADLMGGGAVRQ